MAMGVWIKCARLCDKALYTVFKQPMHHTTMITREFFLQDRLRASFIHISLSVFVAALSASLVFGLWYPYPYRDISGGRELFLLVVTVDVILGPLITLAVFDRRKSWRVLSRDLGVVVLLQMCALGYGLWTVAVARPVHLVFEIDRFRIVHAIDVPQELIPKTPADITALPFSGPSMLGVRAFRNGDEQVEMTITALQGVQLGFRPDLWQSYDSSRPDVLKVAKPVSQLKARFPAAVQSIDLALRQVGDAAAYAHYVPLAGRKDFWTVLVDGRNATILGFLPLDSF